MAQSPTQPAPSTSLRTRSKPPVNWYPTLQGLNLPQPVVHAIRTSYQVAYGVRDQAAANSDSINKMIQYGIWDDMWNTDPSALPDGALWFVTDRPSICYQVRLDKNSNSLQWFFAAGVQATPLLPKNTGNLHQTLGINDYGYMQATGGGYLQVWDGTQMKCLIFGACP